MLQRQFVDGLADRDQLVIVLSIDRDLDHRGRSLQPDSLADRAALSRPVNENVAHRFRRCGEEMIAIRAIPVSGRVADGATLH